MEMRLQLSVFSFYSAAFFMETTSIRNSEPGSLRALPKAMARCKIPAFDPQGVVAQLGGRGNHA
jgi:hypothetical protein